MYRRILASLGVAVVMAACLLPTRDALAACDALPGDKGLANLSVSIDEPGQYAIWLRMHTPSTESSDMFVQIDDQCPNVIGKAQSGTMFQWTNTPSNDAAKQIRFELTAGTHILKIAGHKSGVGVDKVLLLRDTACKPVDLGDNCTAQASDVGLRAAPRVDTAANPSPTQTDRQNWLVISICAFIIASTIGFLAWKYKKFTKQKLLHAEAVGDDVANMALRTKLGRFLRHHKILVFLCCDIILLTLAVGVVTAVGRFAFEAESATLYGGAKIADNAQASGGKYVVFESNPPGKSVPKDALQQTGSSGTNPPSNNNNNANNNTGGTQTPPGGGTHTPGQCPAYPAFPDDNCTGWQHTGVTLQTCVEGDGDEGDGHLEKPNVTYDGCDFANGAVVHAPNVTIKRSRIQGVVSAHWSTDYDFQNLQLIDVEIVAANPAQIAAKNMVNESGGSALNGANVTCLRCRIHYVPTGISLGNGSTIQDSYISDVTWGPGAHQAAIGAGGNSGHNSKIIHNRLDCSRWNVNAPSFQQGCSSALSLYDEPTLNNVLVENNLFDTAGGYCTYGGGPQGTNIRYINNRFGKKYAATCGIYGTVTAFYGNNSGNVWSGNAWQDGSGAVNP